MSKGTTIEIDAAQYQDHDNCLTAAADDYISEHPDVEGYDLSPRWGDADRGTILLDVPCSEDQWWAWHDADSSRWSPDEDDAAATADAERRCASWVSGESDDGPEARPEG